MRNMLSCNDLCPRITHRKAAIQTLCACGQSYRLNAVARSSIQGRCKQKRNSSVSTNMEEVCVNSDGRGVCKSTFECACTRDATGVTRVGHACCGTHLGFMSRCCLGCSSGCMPPSMFGAIGAVVARRYLVLHQVVRVPHRSCHKRAVRNSLAVSQASF
jgi:hypothetical protein